MDGRMAEAVRPYDAPDIDALQFLSRVMHDTTVDLKDRMTAADLLMQMGLANYKEETVTITIRGGMPLRAPRSGSPQLKDFSPELQRDLLRIKRSYQLIDPYVDWEVKGNA
jgi:hypothetical protein